MEPLVPLSNLPANLPPNNIPLTTFFPAVVDDVINNSTLVNRTDTKNDRWYLRVWFNDQRKYKWIALKTADLQQAVQVAFQHCVALKVKLENSVPIFSATVEQIANEAIERKRKKDERESRHPRTFVNFKSKMDRFVIGYFKNRQMASLTQADIDNFWNWRIDYWITHKKDAKANKVPVQYKRPNSMTLHNEIPVIKALFDEATKRGLVRADRKFSFKPPVKRTKGRRSALTQDELDLLMLYLMKWANTGNTKTVKFARLRMSYLIKLAVLTGMRPPEFYNLKWSDVNLLPEDAKEGDFVWTALSVHGKGKKHTINVDVTVYTIFQQYMIALNDMGYYFGKDSHVFTDAKGNRLTTLNAYFKELLVAVGIPLEYQGESRTLYSLRHTFATLCLMRGITINDLADNMDTGIAQIREHYGHVPTPDKAKAQIIGVKLFNGTLD